MAIIMLCLRRTFLYSLLVTVTHCLLIHAQGPGPGSPGLDTLHSRAVDMWVQFEILEEQPEGMIVGSIPVRPGFTYRFNENPKEFYLNGTTGLITTTNVLDREALRSDRFDLVVLSSQPTYPIEVRITVIDINDNAPIFPEPNIRVQFSESANAGTRLLLDTATDGDAGTNDVTAEYQIVAGNDDGAFRLIVITNPSGEAPFLHLETTGKLDRETKSFYQLNISAQDGGEPPLVGYLLVNVSIIDVNDNPPIFDHSDYIVSLNESVPPGTVVLQVMATDNDLGDNAKLTYYLAEGEMQFGVDPETGVISTVEALNCQQNCPQLVHCPKSCVFTVFARDHGTPRQDGRTYITVNLVDANDHDPVIRFRYFPATASAATVDENAQNSSVVAAVSVIDFDEGLNGQTTVTIRSGNELNHFRLESTPSFDLVRVNGVLDREKISKYNLTIVATDKGSPPRSTTAYLIINVNDINDHEPVFEKSEYSAVVSELVPVGTYVASITATDEDTGINSEIYYTIVSGNDRRWLDIDTNSGLVTTMSALDREQEGTVILKISARDGGPNPKWAYTQLKIIILDENDESPKFRTPIINVNLSESASPSSLVAVFSAIDHDQGTNGSITYLLDAEMEHTFPGMFDLDSTTGRLTTKTKLDRENIANYVIKVLAKDQGTPQLSSTATVLLHVEDVNDNSPEFYPQEYFVTVPEDLQVGSSVAKVSARDADEGDNAAIKFQIEGGGEGVFDVDINSGIVILKNELRTKRKKQYQLRISAKDRGERRAVADAIVEIVVETNELGFLEFSQKPNYKFKILEDHSRKEPMDGREVGQVQVNGVKSGQMVRYSIASGDTDRVFTIDERSGVIRTARRIDRETQSEYDLVVTAKTGHSYGSTNVSIIVEDLNDNQPKFTKVREVGYVKENAPIGKGVFLAQAVDFDDGSNSEITYSLSINPDNYFSINSKTGLISLNKPVTLGKVDVLNLEVIATDGGVPSLSARQQLSIRIVDVNDHTPVFDQSSYETSLLESTPVNNRFFALTASDQDEGENGFISYEITQGNVGNKFGVFPDGYLYVKSTLDREDMDYYGLTVISRDHGEPVRSSSVSVVIHVIDENDNEPKFTNYTFNFYVLENEPPDTFVGKLTATDIDVGRNAELTFSLPTTQADFFVDAKNGFVKTLHYFDRETLVRNTGQSFISMEAVVSDSGTTKLKDKAKINIYITDVNDNAPEFIRKPYKSQITEGAPINSNILRVFALDWDEGLNGDIVYSIVNGNKDGNFKIDSNTGQITIIRQLDRETVSQYILTILVQDAGQDIRLNSTTQVTIDILDENDNAPEFTLSESQFSISEDTTVNTHLLQFQASDSDLGINKAVTFSITGGNRHDAFRIDPQTGNFYLNRPLDYERLNVFYLNITASDSGNPRLATTIPFLVRVQDCNDNAPVFPNTALVRQIQEGLQPNTPIVTVTAEDPDSGSNGQVKYSLSKQEPHGEHFGIHPDQGVIHTLRPIDREFTDTFRLTVIATDQAEPTSKRLSAEKLVTVIVEDINDNAPFFVSMNAGILTRNNERGTEIMHVTARDLDTATNGLVTYELISGDSNLFHIHRSTGVLTLKRSVTEPNIRYYLTIKASDEAVQSQRKSTETYITIIGTSSENQQSPVFDKPKYSGSVYENEPVSTNIVTIAANSPTRAEVEYYVVNITSNGRPVERLFDVDSRLGIVSTARVLDRESGTEEYEITIYAISLRTTGPQTTSIKVHVTVLDRNDIPPTFGPYPLTFNVSEDIQTGKVITIIKATDPDTPGNLNYSLIEGGENKFSLDSRGVLKATNSLDREQMSEYQLTIRADDGRQHQDTKVDIKVTDTNDNPPLFSEPVYSFDILEDASRGAVIGTITAHDADEGDNKHVTYSVLSDWGNDIFTLNPQSGVFTISSKLDYEEVQHYILVVSAQDAGKPSLSSTVTVYFNVLDLNDNSPIFDPMSYNDEVDESVPIGTSVLTVTATDLDSGDNGLLEYRISYGNERNDFEMLPNGTLYTSRELDRETIPSYVLTVQATDHGKEVQLSSTVQVNIVVRDVNDMSPEFLSPNVTFVMENSPPNSVLMVVQAADKDEGRNSYVEYTLDGSELGDVPFVLGPVDGLLRLVGVLDRETRSNYSLRITANDRGEPPRSTTTDVLVQVLDENDNGPLFDPKQYSATLAENSSIGLSVLQVSATDIDDDMNGRVRFAIISGDQNRDFYIGEDTGLIRVAKNLNYERQHTYVLHIQAEDSGDSVRYDSATVRITITDINDNAPVFLDSPYIAHVLENTANVPAPIIQVSAFDADTSPHNQVRYMLKDGDKGLFKINATSGLLTVHRSLDRETQSHYMLTVIAMDSGTPRLTGTGTVIIQVEDTNDHSPIFERNQYFVEIKENLPINTFVLQVTASDKDSGINAQITYTLEGDTTSLSRFHLNSSTGTFVTRVPLDREEKTEYKFKVIATDGSLIGAHSATTVVIIRVIDENDHSPNFHNEIYVVQVPEGTQPGQYVLGLEATDSDEGENSRIKYYMGGADADKFDVGQTTGVIKAARELRAESSPFRIEIRASDSGSEPLITSTQVEVQLMPASLFPKISLDRDSFTLAENSGPEVITRASGKSPKSGALGKLHYEIAGGNINDAFAIDHTTGLLSVSGRLDYESTQQYELWVEARDSDTPSLSSVAKLHVNITDFNDNAPVFEKLVYNASVFEDEHPTKLVTVVHAIDADSGKNGQVRYQLQISDSDELPFVLNADTGEILTTAKLDREEISSYKLTVEAIDQGTPQQTGSVTVEVTVKDKNDNPPRFTRLFSVNVTENAEPGTFVIQVTSVDRDTGENANATYSFTDNPSGKFHIDPLTGNVTVSGILDREIQDEYVLKVAAVDGSWHAETPLTITIQDQNDNAPEFEHSYYNFNLGELPRSVAFVGQVTATDHDKQGPNSIISYSLKYPSDFFNVDPASGEILSKQTMKHKHSSAGSHQSSPENQYPLVVIAMDNGKPPMSSECNVVITVVDVNNNAPKFEKSNYFSPVLDSASVGDKIIRVFASDTEDFGVNAQVEYSTIKSNGSQLFTIDKDSGWILVGLPLSKLTSAVYTLKVQAEDKGVPPQRDEATITLMITGENLHSPVFNALKYRVIVPENEPLGSSIVSISAVDSDREPNGMIRYRIEGGVDKFGIDPNTGIVSITNPLDYDTLQEYQLNITAEDLGFKPRSTSALLTVILTDVNDNPPTFNQTSYDTFLPENSPPNTVVFRLQAKDIDSTKNAIIKYAIVGGNGKEYFSLHPVQGIITAKRSFDYEENNLYILDVLASNPDSSLYGAATLNVHITGENEFYPKFVQAAFQFTVSESASIGTKVGEVQATDKDLGDDGVIYYLFVGSSNDRGFNINPRTGVITVGRRLDRESQSRVVLTVLTKNWGSIRGNDTDEAQVIITIQDGNDPPAFQKLLYEAGISESSEPNTPVVTVKAVDKDVRPKNNRFTYSIIGGNVDKAFQVDSVTGLVSTSSNLDREKVPKYDLIIGAIDTGTPPQTGSTEVRVLITDINDNGPLLEPASVLGFVSENEPPMTSVMTLAAHDLDLHPNGPPFTYTLIGGRHQDFFHVDKSTGVVTTSRSIDREISPELQFVVEIEDSGIPKLKSQHEVTVIVKDKNDSPSSPRVANVLVNTYQNMFPRGKIADVHPMDPDVTGQYHCLLLRAPDNAFSIPHDCDLHLSHPPLGDTFTLSVPGSDGQHPEVVSSITVNFESFNNVTIDNSVTIRIFNLTADKFLKQNFKAFVEMLNNVFQEGNIQPQLFSILTRAHHVDVTLSVQKPSSKIAYLYREEVLAHLHRHSDKIQQALNSHKFLLGFTPCTPQTCENNGKCTEKVNVYNQTQIIDSRNMIFTSPLVRHEFNCACTSGYTGPQCEYRQDPCSPNPCESNGVCTKSGFDFACQCQPGRQGKRCEIERNNLCRDSPCKNGGTCRETLDGGFFCLCRYGYLGNQCELAADSCRPNPCMNGGSCVGLKPGYHCQCLSNYYGAHCEKSSFGFGELSYMTFPTLDSTTNDISLIFSTNKADSLLVYNFGDQTGGRSDFVAIELRDGKPTFSFGGARTAVTPVMINKFTADSKWYKLTATRNSRVVSLTLSSCNTGGEICNDCRQDDNLCHADAVGPTGTLNFNSQPLYLGGIEKVDPILERRGQVLSDDFIGCIHSVSVNGRALDLTIPLASRDISNTCQRVENVCSSTEDNGVCGLRGSCIDLWMTNSCQCEGGLFAPNCNKAMQPISLIDGGFVEFKVTEKYRRVQLMQSYGKGRNRRELNDMYPPAKSLSVAFRTVRKDVILLYTASNADYTLLQLLDGHLKYTSKLGPNAAINMSMDDPFVSDGEWHMLGLHMEEQVFSVILDGTKVGEELDAASVHDFLDAYLTSVTIGGSREERFEINNSRFEGCLANFTINGELQPFNGSGSVFPEVLHYGRIVEGCSNSVAGAATAPDPLSIGVTLVIVFFVILIVAILVSFVVFRLRRQKREKTPSGLKQNGTVMIGGMSATSGDGSNMRGHPDTSYMDTNEMTTDVLRNHINQELALKKLKEREVIPLQTRPDIIEREVMNKSPAVRSLRMVDDNVMNPPMVMGNSGMVVDSPEGPEHYDLENASSIAPSDIDIVYHYKGYRDGNLRKYKATPHIPNYHKHSHRHSPHNFPPPMTPHRESPCSMTSITMRQSPSTVAPPRDSPSVLKMQSTPLARLSPSSELSQQTPRILTLQDISGKPLQTALLTTAQVGKDTMMTNSERSLNSPVSHLSQSSESMRMPSQDPKKRSKDSGVTIGLTAEEIERLNSRPKNSSLVSTLDAVSSSSNGHQHEDKLAEPPDSSTDESGNDSFTCSEFEYENNYESNSHPRQKRRHFNSGMFSKLTEVNSENVSSNKRCNGFDSFRGSLSTLVASDDDISYANTYNAVSSNGASLGWDYLLNWGPNFENLAGVFKDISELPDVSGRISRHSNSTPKPSEEYV